MTSTPPLLQALNKNTLPFSRPPTPGMHAHQLGFVGLGAMGYNMARNLANKQPAHPAGSPPLLVYNRTKEKAEALLKELGPNKIRIAESLGQVARECDVVVTSLASDEVVNAAYKEFREALKDSKHTKAKIFVETSTIYPSLAGAFLSVASPYGFIHPPLHPGDLDKLISDIPHTHLITCPVFGRPEAAESSQLILVMAGDYHSKKEVAYILVPAVGRKVFDLGGNLEKAPTFKLIGNSMILGFLEVMSESMTMSEKTGIGAETAFDLIKEMFPAPPLLNYGSKIVNNDFDGSTGFAIDGGIKDASHIRRLTNEHNAPMPMIDIAHQHLLTARALHAAQRVQGKETYKLLDWSAVVAGSRVAAGLDGLGSGTTTKVVKD